jgi:hypothetical protein
LRPWKRWAPQLSGPASIGDDKQAHKLVDKHQWQTKVFHQCDYRVDDCKPTRILADGGRSHDVGMPGWPALSKA